MAAKASYDLVVIGAGSGGLEAAWNAAVLYKQKVAVIDTQKEHGPPNYAALGGTCVNVGCVPKKLFVNGANFMESFKDSVGFGWDVKPESVGFNWKTLLAAKNKAVSGINESYVEMFQDAKMDFVQGWAWFQDKNTVLVREAPTADAKVLNELSAKTVLIATGGWPFKAEVPGVELAITSNEAFYLEDAPKRTLIVGGGYIAVEFASIFYSFRGQGGVVDLAYRSSLFLRGFDTDVREELRDQMTARGINLMFNENVTKIEKNGDGSKKVTFTSGKTADYDVVMYATGRVPRTGQINIEASGVKLAKDGAVEVDNFSKTNVEGVYAIGDVTNRVQLTPVAIHEGSAFADTVFGNKPTPVDHTNIPSAVFSIPQIGTVGLTQEDAAKKFDTVAIYKTISNPLMHKISGNTYKRFSIKIVVDHATGTVIGVHICGADSGEIIQGVGIAVKMGAKISDFYRTIGVHPTSAEEICSLREPSYYLVKGTKVDKLPQASL